jgi:hypothetical protein
VRPLVWAPTWNITDPEGKVYVYLYKDDLKSVGAELKRRGVPPEHQKRFVELLDPKIEMVDRQRRNAGEAGVLGLAIVGFGLFIHGALGAIGWVTAGFVRD